MHQGGYGPVDPTATTVVGILGAPSSRNELPEALVIVLLARIFALGESAVFPSRWM
jgi:hypothetical protein